MLANLRRLDRVSVESKKGNFFEEHDAGDAIDEEWQDDGDEGDYFPVWDPEHDGGQDDEEEIIDEDDLIDTLASYQDVRNAFRQNHNARGFYPPTTPGGKGKKGQSKGSSFGPFPQGKGNREREPGSRNHDTRVETSHKMSILWPDRALE